MQKEEFKEKRNKEQRRIEGRYLLTDGRMGVKALPELITGDLTNPRGTQTSIHFTYCLPARPRDF